jgi:transcriptional regulator with XRE-family HTH domain
MILGELIKSWRKDHEVSLREAAKMMGLDLNALHRLEHGKTCDGENLVRVLKWTFGAARVPRK